MQFAKTASLPALNGWIKDDNYAKIIIAADEQHPANFLLKKLSNYALDNPQRNYHEINSFINFMHIIYGNFLNLATTLIEHEDFQTIRNNKFALSFCLRCLDNNPQIFPLSTQLIAFALITNHRLNISSWRVLYYLAQPTMLDLLISTDFSGENLRGEWEIITEAVHLLGITDASETRALLPNLDLKTTTNNNDEGFHKLLPTAIWSIVLDYLSHDEQIRLTSKYPNLITDILEKSRRKQLSKILDEINNIMMALLDLKKPMAILQRFLYKYRKVVILFLPGILLMFPSLLLLHFRQIFTENETNQPTWKNCSSQGYNDCIADNNATQIPICEDFCDQYISTVGNYFMGSILSWLFMGVALLFAFFRCEDNIRHRGIYENEMEPIISESLSERIKKLFLDQGRSTNSIPELKGKNTATVNSILTALSVEKNNLTVTMADSKKSHSISINITSTPDTLFYPTNTGNNSALSPLLRVRSPSTPSNLEF